MTAPLLDPLEPDTDEPDVDTDATFAYEDAMEELALERWRDGRLF